MRSRRRHIGVLLAALLLSAGLWAEEVTVLVRDPDLDQPLAGARVQVGEAAGTSDASGKVTLNLPSESPRILVVTFPGYDTYRAAIPPQTEQVTVSLRLASVVSGPGVVVEQPRPSPPATTPGESQTVTREAIRNTAEVGVFEDLVTSLQLLPGVGYGGSFNAQPSVRGGDPSETAAYLDGAPILFPYHWGGIVSIFDPSFIESARLSDGVISARFGNALSGLLDVSSKSALIPQPRLDLGLSTTGLDVTARYPVSERLGILLGGKGTWMELPFALYGASRDFYAVPYIRDGYARVEWKPADAVHWNTNFFLGSDGFNQKETSILDIAPSSYSQEDFHDVNWEISSSVQWLRTAQELLTVVASVNQYHQSIHASNPNGDFHNVSSDAQAYTLSAEWNRELGGGNLLAVGASDSFLSVQNNFNYYDATYTQRANVVPPRDDANTWSGYALDRFLFLSGHFEGELGLRLDGVQIFGSGFNLALPPALNPRLRVQYNPFATGGMRGLELHVGSGLYSQVPLDAFYFSGDPASGVVSQSLKPERSWIAEAGSSFASDDGWRFSLDGYYKAYWNRLYEFYYTDPATVLTTLHLYNDGTGYATGAEVMIQNAGSRYWDGWVNYTLNVTRYLNPSTGGLDPMLIGAFFPADSPVGVWYFPIYQRLHTVNLVLNWKPAPWLTVTTVGTFATGTPPYQAVPNVTYSDSAREPDLYVLNLKLSAHGYYRGTKVGWEFYAAVQNLLASLLHSGTVANEIGDQAYFNFGYPVPSFGYKISY